MGEAGRAAAAEGHADAAELEVAHPTLEEALRLPVALLLADPRNVRLVEHVAHVLIRWRLLPRLLQSEHVQVQARGGNGVEALGPVDPRGQGFVRAAALGAVGRPSGLEARGPAVEHDGIEVELRVVPVLHVDPEVAGDVDERVDFLLRQILELRAGKRGARHVVEQERASEILHPSACALRLHLDGGDIRGAIVGIEEDVSAVRDRVVERAHHISTVAYREDFDRVPGSDLALQRIE